MTAARRRRAEPAPLDGGELERVHVGGASPPLDPKLAGLFRFLFAEAMKDPARWLPPSKPSE